MYTLNCKLHTMSKHQHINKPNFKKVIGPTHNPDLDITEHSIKPVPKFHTSSECLSFIQNFPEVANKLMNYKIVTNFEELKETILGGISKAEHEFDTEFNTEIRKNLPKEFEPILNIVDSKREVYKGEFEERLLNTLDYLFYHMRCGIYCRIEDNKIKQFIVFVNKDYVNNWSQYLKFEGENGEIVDMDTYYQLKRKYYRKENILPKERWWLNSGVIDNEMSENLWGMHLISSITDMLYYTSQTTKLKNTSFFINKRDYPQLRADLTEPYAFVFPEKTKLPREYLGKGFIPIHSWFSSTTFSDILVPSTDDWDIISGMVTLAERPIDRYCNIGYEKYKHIKWEDKINRAFFRGSATMGTTSESNQRIHLAKLSYEYNGNSVEPKPDSILDSGLVSLNVRDKIPFHGSPVTFTRRDKIGFPLSKFVPMSEQMRNKYVINTSGHAAASRFMYLMKMKVLILKIEPIRPEVDELWFFPLLKAGEDYISIKSDLSDLIEKINWCIAHDEQCKNIAKSAYKKYRTLLTKSNVLNYYAYCINSF